MTGIEAILRENFARITQNSKNQPEICPKCHEPTRKSIDYHGEKFFVPVICKCEKERMEKEEEDSKNRRKFERIKSLRSLSLLGAKYENVSFDTSQTGVNPSFDAAFKRCLKYCEVYRQVLEKGMGIYLFGDKGTGKTHLTACMANELLRNCVPVLFTNLFEISKAIKSTFKKDSSVTEKILFDRFLQVDFLFFDDLGTEIFLKNSDDTWLQGLLFELINGRYNANKPTIFSSNYSLNELVNQRGISEQTVDRIAEMTDNAVMKITGKSRRKNTNSEKMIF